MPAAPTWRGVLPAMTTPLGPDGTVDHGHLADRCRALAATGCTALVALGSLGESATLGFDEKVAVLTSAVAAVADSVPVVAGIAALSTAEAVRLARAAADCGCGGLMILPPYAHAGDWPESRAHVRAVLAATDLPAMLYNNPPAYRTDFLPEQIAELARDVPRLVAVKESSGDIRRLAAIRALIGDRLALLVGVDDLVVEAVLAGADGWVAGLVNAFPEESVRLFDLALAVRDGTGDRTELAALYAWFLPLLRLDTVPKFVQLIKLAQEMTGTGPATVRPPRMELSGAEREAAVALIATALATRPAAGRPGA